MDKETVKAGAYLEGLWGPGSSGVIKGGPKKKEKRKEKKQKERKKERKKRKRREKDRQKMKERGSKKEKIKVSQHDERGAMQFHAQAGLKGRKLQGRQIDGEKR